MFASLFFLGDLSQIELVVIHNIYDVSLECFLCSTEAEEN